MNNRNQIINSNTTLINAKTKQSLSWLTLLAFISLFSFVTLSCKQAKDEAELTVLGADGGYTYFKGDLNMNIMSDCGKATVATSQSGSGSNTSNDKNTWDIESYFVFTYGEYIFTKFTYNKQKNRYSLNPTTTTGQTCDTNDGIKCFPNGAMTCETADSINCGGNKSFIFRGGMPPTVFQAVSGTIRYNPFSVNEQTNTVTIAHLEFEMVDNLGRVMKGKIQCESTGN